MKKLLLICILANMFLMGCTTGKAIDFGNEFNTFKEPQNVIEKEPNSVENLDTCAGGVGVCVNRELAPIKEKLALLEQKNQELESRINNLKPYFTKMFDIGEAADLQSFYGSLPATFNCNQICSKQGLECFMGAKQINGFKIGIGKNAHDVDVSEPVQCDFQMDLDAIDNGPAFFQWACLCK